MNQDEIIELAKRAGFVDYELDDGTTSAFDKRYERFAALVAAAERKVWADEFAGMGEWTCVNIIEGKLGEAK